MPTSTNGEAVLRIATLIGGSWKLIHYLFYLAQQPLFIKILSVSGQGSCDLASNKVIFECFWAVIRDQPLFILVYT